MASQYIQKAENGFMKVNVEPGQTKLVLTFIPQGFMSVY